MLLIATVADSDKGGIDGQRKTLVMPIFKCRLALLSQHYKFCRIGKSDLNNSNANITYSLIFALERMSFSFIFLLNVDKIYLL